MLEKVKVSVIITTYKRNDFLLRAIKSVISQSFKNIELIVVNDSLEDKVIITKLLKDYNLKLYHSNLGDANSARKMGYLNATGKYICFLDDDDFWDVHKIQSQVEIMESNPSVILVTSNGKEIFEDNSLGKSIITSPDLNLLLYGNFVGGFSFACIRNSCIKPDYFWIGLESGQDWFFWIKLMLDYPKMKMGHNNSVGVYYQKSLVNITNNPSKKRKGFFKVYNFIKPLLHKNHLYSYKLIKSSDYNLGSRSVFKFIFSGIFFIPFYSYLFYLIKMKLSKF